MVLFLVVVPPTKRQKLHTPLLLHIFFIYFFLNRIFNYNYEIIKTRHCVVLYVISAAPKNIIIKKTQPWREVDDLMSKG